MKLSKGLFLTVGLVVGLTSCLPNNTIQSTEETIKKSGFVAPNKFETSVLFPDYMVADYKSRSLSTKGFSIKRMQQVDAVRVVIKSEQDGTKQEKIVYPTATQVSATFDNVTVGRVKVYAEAWGTGGYQASNPNNLITSGEAYVAVSENKLSEVFIALEIPQEQINKIIETKYGKGSVRAVVALVEKTTQTSINTPTDSNPCAFNPRACGSYNPNITTTAQPVITEPTIYNPNIINTPQPIVTSIQPVQVVSTPQPSFKYTANTQSTTTGGGTYGSILRMMFVGNTFIVEKISGEFSKDSTVELKVGTYQDFGVTKATTTIKAGGFRKEVAFDFNSITDKWEGGKDFFFVIKNSEGGSSWVGPIKISRELM